MKTLSVTFQYEWRPFTLGGQHLTFLGHVDSRLEKAKSSHWGSVIYKWEGKLNEGIHSNQTGILIGETKDIRQRIKQYVSGPQERGNKLWRETFLSKGEIYLFVLEYSELSIQGKNRQTTDPENILSSANMRLVLEQLLVQEVVSSSDKTVWVVNARQ